MNTPTEYADVEAIDCADRSSIHVTVYSTGASCMHCKLTIRRLKERGIPHKVVDLSADGEEAAREYVTEELGYSEAPVVVIDDHHHWSGFDPVLIDRLAFWAIEPHATNRTHERTLT